MTKAPRLLGTWLQIFLWQDQSELLPVSGSQGSFIFLLQVELQRSCCQRHCSRSFSHGVVWKKHDPLLAFLSSILPVFLPTLHTGQSDCSDYSTATGARRNLRHLCFQVALNRGPMFQKFLNATYVRPHHQGSIEDCYYSMYIFFFSEYQWQSLNLERKHYKVSSDQIYK